mgnify:CR=1 FL=1|tara:strand:+ start:232 stop:471 length:240 start_codon:yes stop_codon:yes gene_type:complete
MFFKNKQHAEQNTEHNQATRTRRSNNDNNTQCMGHLMTYFEQNGVNEPSNYISMEGRTSLSVSNHQILKAFSLFLFIYI